MVKIASLFKNLKTRNLIIILAIVIIASVFIGIYWSLHISADRPGTAKIAGVPRGVEFTPGEEKLSKQYLQTLLQSEKEQAQEALQTGRSAVPTLVGSDVANYVPSTELDAGQQRQFMNECCKRFQLFCKSKESSAADLLNEWTKGGKLSPITAAELSKFQEQGVSVGDYATELGELVKEGKLTPEQAKQLLASYKQEHEARPIATADDLIDQMVSTGELSPDVATQLKNLSAGNASVSDYAQELKRLVREGKLTPAQAKQLLSAYQQQHGLTTTATANDLVSQMANVGALSPEVANQLKGLSDRGATVSDYAAELGRLVKEGKLTPDQAQKLLTAYRQEHGLSATPTTANDLVDQMVGQGEIPPDVASQLKQLSNSGASIADYKTALDRMVQDGKLTPEQAQKLLQTYQQEKSAPTPSAGATNALIGQLVGAGVISPQDGEMIAKLCTINVPLSQYAARLSQLVGEKKLTPKQAEALISACQSERGTSVPLTGNEKMDELKKAQEQQAFQQQVAALQQQQETYAKQQESVEAREAEGIQKAVKAMQSAMSNQAQQLFTSWQAIPQKYEFAPPKPEEKETKQGEGQTQETTQEAVSGAQQNGASGQNYPMIKTGTIMFAVLDTAVNSDQPGPVMATIVSGKLKGAKLMGGLSQTPDGERVVLSFNMLTMPDWPETIGINAVAINPDTARTAIASSVDHHYLMRYGAIFAASFISGYATAVQNEGSSVISAGTTTTTHAKLSSGERAMVGLGEVGKQISGPVRDIFNKKPTVRVSSGVGIGILFTNDVQRVSYASSQQAQAIETQKMKEASAAETIK